MQPTQTDGQPRQTAQQQITGQQQRPIMQRQVSDLEGESVQDQEGQNLGDIEMVVRDRQSGRISAVLGVGGFLGLGEKRVALPTDQLQVDQDGKIVATIGASADELKRQANFDGNRYDKLSGPQVLTQAAATPGARQWLLFHRAAAVAACAMEAVMSYQSRPYAHARRNAPGTGCAAMLSSG